MVNTQPIMADVFPRTSTTTHLRPNHPIKTPIPESPHAKPKGAAFPRPPPRTQTLFTCRRRLSVMAARGSGGSKLLHVLSVAGSDSGAGAGIQADLKACGALGVYCSTVITAVTAQNTVGVQGVHLVPEEFVAEQLNSVLSDMEVDVVKTGMLPSVGIIKVLSRKLKEFPPRALVVDPVLASTSGDMLSAPSTLSGYKEELFPLADLVTPNLFEASKLLAGASLETVADMYSAAKTIHSMGPKYVLVKGGHLKDSAVAIDVFFDGKQVHELKGPRVETRNTHGTGCTMASCIAAELAKGSNMLQAVKVAKRFVESALLHGKYLAIGSGIQGPFDHLFQLKAHNDVSNKTRFNPDSLLLYAVTDSIMNRRWGRSITDAVKSVIEGGATIIQLREKEAETVEFLESAKACMEICRSKGVPLLINDRVDVALACDADGVHVGQSDLPVSTVRRLFGPDKIIGVSCKTPEQAHQALVDGADYIGCGGVYPTNTKANNRTIGLDGLKSVCLSSDLPVVAIGGIKVENASAVMQIGVPSLKGVAVVSALFDQACVPSETRRFRTILMDSLTISK